MRTHVFLFMILAVVLGGCHGNSDKLPSDMVNNPNSASGKKQDKQPEIEFEKTTHDFGQVIHGEVVSYYFKFQNNGNADLLIADVSASCGCTVTEYPQEPIKPGEEETLLVTFDSNNRQGFQNKKITVSTNGQPAQTELSIKAKIIRP
ncbi:MAG: DUF1573 domain-containing protein [Bacteroidota bacterium]